MTNTGKIAIGVAVGTVLGATLGILFTPKSGRETRAIIAKKSRRLGDASVQTYSKAKDLLGFKKNKHDELATV